MGFYENMASLAERMVEKFTLGDAIISNISSETYDTTLGQTTRTYETKTVPYAPANKVENKEENWAKIYIGIYVAGDCRKDSLSQVISACGEGAKAGYSVHNLLAEYD